MGKNDVHVLRAVPGESTDPSEPQRITPATEEKQDEIIAALLETANHTSDLFNIVNSTVIPSLANIEADIEEIRATVPRDLITLTLGGSADGPILTPSSGSKLRIYSLKFCVDADTFTQVSFNGSGASGTLETYFNPKTGGLYGGSRGQNYTELETDETLDIDVTGTGNYAVNVRYIEVV